MSRMLVTPCARHRSSDVAINGELSVLRQVLKRAKLWYRFDDEYTTLRNRKPSVGRALTAEEQTRLFEVARTNPAWLFACVAATLSFYCGLPACESRHCVGRISSLGADSCTSAGRRHQRAGGH
jgi:hypothetical protein